jgi:VIT1/CCC1 family predicted Fe2+/Mn2+ transporter
MTPKSTIAVTNRTDARDALQTEIDAAFLYRTLAEMESQPDVARVYREMAQIEQRHISERQGQLPPLPPSGRARTLAWLAHRFGSAMILSTLTELEKSLAFAQQQAKVNQGIPLTGNENAHARILEAAARQSGQRGMTGGILATLEGRHRSMGGNSLRAAVLGANDGLVSNLSLVMGVAGATLEGSAILVAGFAGLLAGSISMALGEWLSVQSSRELYARQLAVEAAELENNPEQEALELALIYQAKGVSKEQSEALSRQLLQNSQLALDTLAREELAIDPEELGGSAWEAAWTSFILFAIGAIIPVFPFLFMDGWTAVAISSLLSAAGLFAIGAAITLLTGRSIWFSGVRQMAFGLVAALITFGIGRLLGVAIAG